jgi:SAM-dependent methyltransferase
MLRWLKTRLGEPKRLWLWRAFRDQPFSLLDVGAGNRSASFIKALMPQCRYYGLDRTRDYNNTPEDFALMEKFYELDLTGADLGTVPDQQFDALLLTHVIEHLSNAEIVLTRLCAKLKVGGKIYIEWPHERSLRLPSMRDSLNFYDDPTHVRLYAVAEVTEALTLGGVRVLESGTRRDWLYLVLSPLLIPYRAAKRGYLNGPDFWDWLGFAQFVTGIKT